MAISFSKSQRVSSLVGGDATEDGTAERGEVGRVQGADVEGDQGSKVAVVLQNVEMRTDTSQVLCLHVYLNSACYHLPVVFIVMHVPYSCQRQ